MPLGEEQLPRNIRIRKIHALYILSCKGTHSQIQAGEIFPAQISAARMVNQSQTIKRANLSLLAEVSFEVFKITS